MKKVRCLGDKVIVRLEADNERGVDPGHDGPLVMADAYTYHSCRGVVVAVGPGVEVWDKRAKRYRWKRPDARVGDRVFVPADFGQQCTFDDEGVEHRFGREPELQLVVPRG